MQQRRESTFVIGPNISVNHTRHTAVNALGWMGYDSWKRVARRLCCRVITSTLCRGSVTRPKCQNHLGDVVVASLSSVCPSYNKPTETCKIYATDVDMSLKSDPVMC